MIDKSYAQSLVQEAIESRTVFEAAITEEDLAAIEAKVDAAIEKNAKSGNSQADVSWDASYGSLVVQVAKRYTAAPGGYLVKLSYYQPDDNEDTRIMMEIKW